MHVVGREALLLHQLARRGCRRHAALGVGGRPRRWKLQPRGRGLGAAGGGVWINLVGETGEATNRAEAGSLASCVRLRSSGSGTITLADGPQHRADGNAGTLGHLDLGQDPCGRRRHLQRHLVGLELEQRLIDVDRIAGLLEPLTDSCLGHRFTERRHRDLDRHLFPPPQSESACATSAFCS